MKIEMPLLPYASNALEPIISESTISFHFGKHLQNYVNALSNLVKGTALEKQSVEDIFLSAPSGALHNNAGQVLNHVLYFSQFCSPKTNNSPQGRLATLICDSFGSFESFKEKFSKDSLSLFGSGWVWLSQDKKGNLVISQEANADNPIVDGRIPLFCVDVWEHAYYLDYQNKRSDYVAAIWNIIDWNVVSSRLVL